MSDSNRIRVSVVPESTFGTTPTDPAWQVLATTGVSMRDRMGYQQSQTINNDRNVQDLIRLSKAAGGGIPMEMTWSPEDEGLMELITGAMAGTETAVYTATGVTTTAAAKTITQPSGDFTTNFEVGDIVKTTGGLTADTGFRKLTAVSALSMTVEADEDYTGDSSGDMNVTRGARIKNGTEKLYFSIEVARLDLQIAQVFHGCVVDGMDFSIADESITTCNFTLQASNSTFYDTALSEDVFGPSGQTPTYTAPTTSPVLDSIAVPQIRSQGSAYAAKSIQMSLANNASMRTQIGALGAQSVRFGEFGASGRITAYLEDFAELQAYEGNTSSDVWLAMIDANGKGYSLSFPEIKYSDAGADVSGSNTDVLEDLAATALKDPTEALTARLQRWD